MINNNGLQIIGSMPTPKQYGIHGGKELPLIVLCIITPIPFQIGASMSALAVVNDTLLSLLAWVLLVGAGAICGIVSDAVLGTIGIFTSIYGISAFLMPLIWTFFFKYSSIGEPAKVWGWIIIAVIGVLFILAFLFLLVLRTINAPREKRYEQDRRLWIAAEQDWTAATLLLQNAKQADKDPFKTLAV